MKGFRLVVALLVALGAAACSSPVVPSRPAAAGATLNRTPAASEAPAGQAAPAAPDSTTNRGGGNLMGGN